MLQWLVDKLIAFAKRTPYSHLNHADGSAYMERYWIIPFEWHWPFSVRLHWIATPDHDRALHDHPWSFISLVLRGWYIERRPVSRRPCFDGGDHELTYAKKRKQYSLAYRWWTDRHRISQVSPGGVWTLFISFNYMHWWGFYTRMGKIYYRDFDSVHIPGGDYALTNSEATQNVQH